MYFWSNLLSSFPFMIMIPDLEKLIIICEVFAHWVSVCEAEFSYFPFSTKMTMSSAYSRCQMPNDFSFVISVSVKIEKRRGAIIDPWGTPFVIPQVNSLQLISVFAYVVIQL